MTEQRLADLFTAIHAFTKSMATVAQGLAEDAHELKASAAQGRQKMIESSNKIADRLDHKALALGAGIEVLHRLADQAMDDTQTMDLNDVAEAADDKD